VFRRAAIDQSWMMIPPALTLVLTRMRRTPVAEIRQRRAGHATAATLDGMGLGAGVPSRHRPSSTLFIAIAAEIGMEFLADSDRQAPLTF
jgi:hypothetical protein